jgi:hypothetical protein
MAAKKRVAQPKPTKATPRTIISTIRLAVVKQAERGIKLPIANIRGALEALGLPKERAHTEGSKIQAAARAVR